MVKFMTHGPRDQNCPLVNIINLWKFENLLPYQGDINWKHGDGVYEALYLYSKVHDPLDRGSGHEVGPVWPHGENVKEFYKYFFLYF